AVDLTRPLTGSAPALQLVKPRDRRKVVADPYPAGAIDVAAQHLCPIACLPGRLDHGECAPLGPHGISSPEPPCIDVEVGKCLLYRDRIDGCRRIEPVEAFGREDHERLAPLIADLLLPTARREHREAR